VSDPELDLAAMDDYHGNPVRHDSIGSPYADINKSTYYDWDTGNPIIAIDNGVIFWNNNNSRNTQSYNDAVWIAVHTKGVKFVNHVIRQTAGLMTSRRLEQEPAEIALDLLYKILESKL
jgi:hypothetical protein